MSHRAGANRPATAKAPSSTACQICRTKKVRCSGTLPCQYCEKRGLSCTFRGRKAKRAYSVARIEELEARLAHYESMQAGENVQPSSSSRTVRDSSSPCVDGANRCFNSAALEQIEPPSTSGDPTCVATAPGRYETSTVHITQNASLAACQTPSQMAILSAPIVLESRLSSSQAFGRKVQGLLDSQALEQQQHCTPIINQSRHASQVPGSWTEARDADSSAVGLPDLPSEEDALRLAELVTFYIGQTYSYFDSREIADQIYMLYANLTQPQRIGQVKLLEVIMVIAIGTVIDTQDYNDQLRLPGNHLFEFVCQHAPPLAAAYDCGKTGISVHALMAFYLQMSNRKAEAYLYINVALRLAVSQRLHLNKPDKTIVRSEQVQLNRLWWTVYMQERRLAAATASPLGIVEAAVQAPLPTDSHGVLPSRPIRTNVKLARIVGRIITELYTDEPETENGFIQRVHQVLMDLSDIAKDIPSGRTTSQDARGSDLDYRTSASLSLFLYQATLLTTRPIMLHLTKLFLEGAHQGRNHLSAEPFEKFSRTSSEAAVRIIKFIIGLRKRALMRTFGFFDNDAIFSAAFSLVLSAVIDPTSEVVHNLHKAMECMEFFSKRGNRAASQALQRINDLWDHLDPIIKRTAAHESDALDSNMTRDEIHLDSHQNYGSDANNCSVLQDVSEIPNQVAENTSGPAFDCDEYGLPVDTDLWCEIANMWQEGSVRGSCSDSGINGVKPQIEAPVDCFQHFQSLLNDPDWFITGEDQEDFTEFQRHVML